MSDSYPSLLLNVHKIAVGPIFFYCAIFYLDYIDIDYSLWLSWLLMPLLITFLLPIVIVVLFYISAIIFHIYRFNRQRLVNTSDWKHRGRQAVAAVWDAHGWLWHVEIFIFVNTYIV